MSQENYSEGSIREVLEFLSRLESGNFSKSLSRPQQPSNLNPIIDKLNQLGQTLAAQAQAQLSTVLDTVPGILFSLSLEGNDRFRFRSANKAFLAATGLRDDQVIGKFVEEVIPPPSLHVVLENYRRAVRTGAAVQWEEMSEYPTGKKYGAVTISPVFDEKGVCTHLVGSVHDITDRRVTEEALKNSEKEFRLLAESMPQMVWIARPDGWSTFVNQQWVNYTGLTPEESCGHGWSKLFHPDDQQRTWDAWQYAIQHRAAYSLEARLRRADGLYQWWLIRGLPVLDEHGIVLKWFGTCTDIDDLKRVEFEKEQFFRFFQTSADVMVIADPNGAFKKMNPACTELLGYSEAELISKPFVEFIHPDDKQSTLDEMASQIKRGSSLNFENRYLCKNGSFKWLSWRSTYIKGEGTTYATARDITERKRIEESLKTSEKRFRETLDAMLEGCMILGFDWSYLYVNESAAQHGQSKREDLLGRTMLEIYPGIEKSVLFKHYQHCMKERIPRRFEESFTFADGTTRWYMFSVEPIPEGIFVLSLDTSERRHAVESMLHAKEAAEKANHTKDLFLSTLSHELRTPLTAILSWAQLLKSGRLDPSKTGTGLQTIEEAAQAQNQLISDLLDISRIGSGKVAMDIQEVEITEVVSRAIKMVRISAEKKTIQIFEQLGSVPIFVSGDSGRLKQIVWNLLTNAIKFTPQGGKIEVTVGLMADASGRKAQIRVRDTGKGLSPDFLPHIFEQFTQADSSSTRVHGGLGLGLALAHGLVKLHGGTIEAQSESEGEGKGSTFTVTLPLSVASHFTGVSSESQGIGATSPEKPTAQIGLSGVHILLVDDEPSTLGSIKETLLFFGAKVSTALCVSDAIAEFEKSAPDVVVSDIAMPNEDGYSLIRKIRQLGHENGGDTPAVALTAYADAETRQKALIAGFQAHLAKPVDSDELVRAILKAKKAS